MRTAVGRPYAVELSSGGVSGSGGSGVEPASVIMAYADLRPIVLWGSWLDSEVIIGIDPMIMVGGLDVASCREPLSVFPLVDGILAGGGIGGGWFTVLGYGPGTSWLAFCDSVLRRRADGTWMFESLGLVGREEAADSALGRARKALASSGAGSGAAPAGIGPLSPVLGVERAAADHLAGVERVVGRIRAGEVYQLNLCTRLSSELRGSSLELFVRTAGALRPAYAAHLPTGPDEAVVSLSPERFLTVGDGIVTTSPIKGTTKQSEDPDGSRLRASSKDAAENVMITDLMRNDLSRVCETGSVAVSGLLEVQPHPGVWHLVSTVTGRLGADRSAADLLAATFPPGSVTGAPKSSAVRAIAVEEPVARGAYTGAAGLITADGRAELSVLIRTFEVSGSQVELGVGGGITVDSVPVLEWRECLHKAEPLAVAAGSRLVSGLAAVGAEVPAELAEQGVFESILVQGGRVLRLADHLARLGRSVRELYAADLPTDLAARVAVALAERPEPRVAVRVHARPSDNGLAVEVTTRPLGPRLESCALVRAERPEHSWRHKWADRTSLDLAEGMVDPALPYFLDPAGFLAETSRGNLFVLGEDRIWRTPPTGDHQLPGVTRRALLDELGDRRVPYEITPISAAELATARSVMWTSSFSGVVAATELDGRVLAAEDTAIPWSRWLEVS